MPTVLVPRRAASAPRYGLRGVPFSRRAYDNPARYKLNGAYGDEFEEASFAELQKRGWLFRGLTAASFGFPGGSTLEWLSTAQKDTMYRPCPSGDFEVVLEFSGAGGARNNDMFGLSIFDASKNGVGFTFDYDGSSYLWTVTDNAYAGTGNSVASSDPLDGRHVWIGLRKVGTSYYGRQSIDGSTWTSTAAQTFTNTMRHFGVSRMYGNGSYWKRLHRVNVYAGPTFFPG